MSIEKLRDSIYESDIEINKLLQKRFLICQQIAVEKKKLHLPAYNQEEKQKNQKLYVDSFGYQDGFLIYQAIHKKSMAVQTEIIHSNDKI